MFVERLWCSAKNEDVDVKGYEQMTEAQRGPSDYFPFDNGQRLHQALDDRTPQSRWTTEDNPRATPSGKQPGNELIQAVFGLNSWEHLTGVTNAAWKPTRTKPPL